MYNLHPTLSCSPTISSLSWVSGGKKKITLHTALEERLGSLRFTWCLPAGDSVKKKSKSHTSMSISHRNSTDPKSGAMKICAQFQTMHPRVEGRDGIQGK